MMVCNNCRVLWPDVLCFGPDEEMYCQNCFDELFFYCDICNKLKFQDTDLDLSNFADTNQVLMVCKKCVKENIIKKQTDREIDNIERENFIKSYGYDPMK